MLTGLREHGIYSQVIHSKATNQIHTSGVYVCTMNSMKGLECDHIIIADLNENFLPLSAGFTEENDDIQINTERRLLYTCMTRAKSTLTLITSGQPSRYLSEIDPSKIEVLYA
jgi:superfamily I DNA/RNA helicase